MNENGNHLYRFQGHGVMTIQEWVQGGGRYADLASDKVEHDVTCSCHVEPLDSPPF